MTSNTIDDEKPNFRPRKFVDANGKSLGMCFCLAQSWGGSTIVMKTSSRSKYRRHVVLDKPGLLGINHAHVEYSLHKQKRWELLDDIHENMTSPLDDESSNESQLKQRKRSHSISTLSEDVYHLEIDSYRSERYRKKPRKPLSLKLIAETRKSEGHTENCYTCIPNQNPPTETILDDITYTIYVSTRRKQIPTIRTNHRRNNFRDRLYRDKKLTEDDIEELSTDDDEPLDSPVASSNVHPLQFKDFLPVATNQLNSKSRTERRSIRHANQFSQETKPVKKISYQSITTDLHHKSIHKPHVPSRSNFKPLLFTSVALKRSELTEEYLSKIYGKDFIHAQCSPTTYLIDLSDRVALNSYLILIFDENIQTDEKICYGQIALNAPMFNFDYLSIRQEKVYRVKELIEKALASKINQQKLVKDETDHPLNPIEFLNQQIQQVHSQTQCNHSINPKPTICGICCEDTNESTPMTALKTCGHWLCNNCWKQYLQTSIGHPKVILCPEWNCTCPVDTGTILSLVNVAFLTIYQGHIENCLVNLCHSYVRCPLTSCSNIIRIVDSSTLEGVRCQCGYEFCLQCRQEAHFPATCRSYQAYILIAKRNGHFTTHSTPITTIFGRKCISCNLFIEKNGGCNHMRCRCGAEFCWICAGYWYKHFISSGIWQCPRGAMDLQERLIVEDKNSSKHFYADAIYHRQQTYFQIQEKLRENARRLIGTIPLDKDNLFDSTISKIQFDQREALLERCFQIIEFMKYLHRICELTCVSAGGYAGEPKQFFNSLRQFESIIFNLNRIFESERGYSAIDNLNQLYQRSQILLQRLRHAVRLQQMHSSNQDGYITS